MNQAVLSPSAVADDAVSRKSLKYCGLASMYYFVPVEVETLGALGEEASAFFCDLGYRIAAVISGKLENEKVSAFIIFGPGLQRRHLRLQLCTPETQHSPLSIKIGRH